ncbi:plasmid pRiA4b ORF-3 family protein [Escherichia coli]|nr:hypothetical protein [Escherichia coli]MDI1421148.1 plasmid pRiA4b ORF-3 family protein [Escherichia coli]HCO9270391.1 hypothetical protein [Escherichia coli]
MYQLKITIRDSKPPIWRRVLVPEQIPFSKLHAVIHNFLMLDIERRVYDLSRINDRLQAIN